MQGICRMPLASGCGAMSACTESVTLYADGATYIFDFDGTHSLLSINMRSRHVIFFPATKKIAFIVVSSASIDYCCFLQSNKHVHISQPLVMWFLLLLLGPRCCRRRFLKSKHQTELCFQLSTTIYIIAFLCSPAEISSLVQPLGTSFAGRANHLQMSTLSSASTICFLVTIGVL